MHDVPLPVVWQQARAKREYAEARWKFDMAMKRPTALNLHRARIAQLIAADGFAQLQTSLNLEAV